jgi:hypothetical protein
MDDRSRENTGFKLRDLELGDRESEQFIFEKELKGLIDIRLPVQTL